MTDEKELYASIRVINTEVNTIRKRLENINSNLHDGIYGEEPKDEDKQGSEMPSESLTSIVRTIEIIQGRLNLTEDYVNRVHISGDVGKSSS